MPEYVTIAQAMALTGVCRRTVYNWLKTGRVVAVRTAGGSVRIDRASLFRPLTTDQRDDDQLARSLSDATPHR